MGALQVRIFPHCQKEFPSEDSLLTWLLTALRGRGGVYHLPSAERASNYRRLARRRLRRSRLPGSRAGINWRAMRCVMAR